jgi:plastocyanin
MSGSRAVAALAGAVLSLMLPASALAETEKIRAVETRFKPKKVEIDVGDRVRWVNKEGTHSIVMKEGRQEVDSIISGDASVVSDEFKDPGKHKFFCRIHRSLDMKGKVIVR